MRSHPEVLEVRTARHLLSAGDTCNTALLRDSHLEDDTNRLPSCPPTRGLFVHVPSDSSLFLRRWMAVALTQVGKRKGPRSCCWEASTRESMPSCEGGCGSPHTARTSAVSDRLTVRHPRHTEYPFPMHTG